MISRRRFLESAGTITVGMALSGWKFGSESEVKKGRVAIVRYEGMMRTDNNFDEKAIGKALEIALSGFGDAPAADVLSRYAGRDDVVGLKVNACFGERLNSTRLELVKGVVRLLKEIGVKENNIIIWDRCIDELEGCGFVINQSKKGVRCMASLTRKVQKGGKPVVGFESKVIRLGSIKTRYAKLATQECSVIINIPVLKSFRNVGISGALKNMYGAIEITEENVKDCHANGCDPGITDVYGADVLRKKTKIAICDGIFPLYNGGPGDDPRYHERYNSLFVATDPLAMDRVGLDFLNDIRAKKGMKALKSAYLNTAYERGLGTNRKDEIEIIQREIPL